MIELENTYLAKRLPAGLKDCPFKEIIDVYIPKLSDHPKIRLRKNGDKFELTKKEPLVSGDASRQEEQTLILTEPEFQAFNELEGKRIRKLRYYYDYEGRMAEIDIFQEALSGLVVVDFEFASAEEKDNFKMPDFCLADVTQEAFLAGGMICGKAYRDIEADLARFGYRPLSI